MSPSESMPDPFGSRIFNDTKTMKTYEILRDGKLFGGFEEGEPVRRFGEKVNDEFMLREFEDCVQTWSHENAKRHKKWKWELRIIHS